MDITKVSATDRDILLNALRLFRAGDDERSADGDDYSNRDRLEEKLQQETGVLDKVDVHLLRVSLADVVPDHDLLSHFKAILGW